jgi:hypothetical protein
MLRRVALVKTDVSEEPSASIIRVTRIGEVGTTLALTSKPTTSANIISDIFPDRLKYAEIFIQYSSKNIPEDGILFNHRRENLKYYIVLTG